MKAESIQSNIVSPTDKNKPKVSKKSSELSTQKQHGGVTGKGFLPGESGNPLGRPKGSISPTNRIKQIFENNPELFETFVMEYINDPSNRKHIVEMLDGKPAQRNFNANINQNFNNIEQIKQNPKVTEVIKEYQNKLRNVLMYGDANHTWGK